MIQTLDDLFELIRKTFRRKKIQYKYFYDEKYWVPIGEILEEITWNAKKWKNVPCDIIKKYMKLPEYYIDGNGKKEKFELNHHVIDSIRIPTNNDPTISNIMKIAVHIGLFQAITHNPYIYESKNALSDFIPKEHLDVKLDLLLGSKDIEFIDTYLNK